MTTVLQLLRDAANAGVRLTVEDGRLRVRAAEGSLTPELRAAITAQRDALVAVLSEDDAPRNAPIAARQDRDVAPLSSGQRRLWLLQQLSPESTVFNLTTGWTLEGNLDLTALQAAVDEVVARHEILRTRFVDTGDGPTQRVDGAGRVTVRSTSDALTAPMVMAEEMARPFDLATEFPLRVRLSRQSGGTHALIVSMHHIASDHASILLFTRELADAYRARAAGAVPSWPALPFQFGDYAAAERHDRSATSQSLVDYWTTNLAGAPRLLELPTDRPRPAISSSEGRLFTFDLAADRVEPLLALAGARGLTPFMALLSAFAVLLSRYSGQTDVCVGGPVSTRRAPGSDRVIGFFVDTQVLRVDVGGDPTVAELFERVRRVVVGALANPLPFDQLVDAVGAERSLSHTPVFQAMLVLQTEGMPALALPGLRERRIVPTSTTAEFDVTLFLEQHGRALTGHVEYRADLFDEPTIAQMCGHFGELIDQMGREASQPVDRLSLSSGAAAVGPESYPFTAGVHEQIAARAASQPTAVAITGPGGNVTYAELIERAHRLARHLVDAGAVAGASVGIRAGSTHDFTIGTLAILSAGCAYVPISVHAPELRVREILQANRIALVVDATMIADSLEARGPHQPRHRAAESDVAAVYHTSGSTGVPMGVQFTHRGLASHADAVRERFALTSSDRVLQFAAWDFDVAAEEIFPTLCAGGAIVERPGPDQSFADFEAYVARHEATVLNLPASFWEAWVNNGANPDALARVRLLIAGSERVTGSAMAKWFAATGGRIRTLNAYGTTEGTITTTVLEVTPSSADNHAVMPVGVPLRYAAAYVLDRFGRPLPRRVAGEIWIGGAGVTAGYVNAPAATAVRFAPDPFAATPGARMMRSGDRGRLLADGTLEVLGRLDRQIKLRGFRIDPRDIEAVLTAHPAVEHCAVVLVRPVGAQERLVAYAAAATASTPSADELRDFVAERMPAYMVPSAVVLVDALPLTSRGKVDLAALEARALETGSPVERIAPRTVAETTLAAIWSELLGVPTVSVTDNFFALGGDSILGIAMISRARTRGLRLKPHSLFEHQTIEQLARHASPADALALVETPGGPAPLSPIQRRFFAEDAAARARYSQAVRVELPVEVDPRQLSRALQAVIEHHPALRHRFEAAPEGWHQEPVAAPPVDIDTIKLAADDREREAAIVASLEDRLDPSTGALVQAALVERPETRALLVVVHHLAVDAVSWSFILEDLRVAYDQLSRTSAVALPPPTTSFAAFASRLADVAVTEDVAAAWENEVRDRGEWPAGSDSEGAAVAMSVELDEGTTAALLEAPAFFNAKVPDALMAALVRGFQASGGRTPLRLDIEGHGRDLDLPGIDITRTVGWFTTIHPLLIDAPPDAALADLTVLVRDARASIPPAFTFDLLRFVQPDQGLRDRLRSAGDAPVLFNYLGVWRAGTAGGSWAATPALSSRQDTAHRSHAIEVNAVVMAGRLQLHWTCGAGLEARVREWSAATTRALETLAADHRRIVAGLGESVEEVLPLSPLQLGLLSHTLRDTSGLSYLDVLTLTLDGELDAATFRDAWVAVVERHAALRTSFTYQDVPTPLQVVRRRVDLDWQVEDLGGLDAAAQAARVDAIRNRETQTSLDLGRAPLMRFRLARLSQTRHVLCWTTSHLILDGWSTAIVFRELFAVYDALRDGRSAQLPAPASFSRFVRSLDRGARDAHAYWRAALADLAAPTPIPQGRHSTDTRPASTRHAVRQITLDEALSSRLRSLAKNTQVSLSTLFQAAWALVNRRDHDQQTVVFGLTVSGRSGDLDGIESMVGALINAVPAVVTVSDDASVQDWLRALHTQHLSRERFSSVGLTTLQRLSPVPAGTELFESLLMVQNYPLGESDGGHSLRVSGVIVDEATHYPVSVIVEPGDRIRLGLSYRPDRLPDAAAERLLAQITAALNAMCDAPEAPVRSISLMTADERRALLEDVSASGELAVEPLVFVRQFEAQAARTPDAIALEFGDRHWTYAELDAEANRWAHGLIGYGCGQGAIVGVCLERSPEHILSVLAIFKAGGAFLPLDPAHPSSRLDMMINDAGVALLITHSAILNELPAFALLTICVDEQSPGDGQPEEAPAETLDGDGLAYVIYTSGSTGSPKGVMGLHRGLGSLAANQRELFGLGVGDRVLQFAPIGFDASLWEIAMALGSGATLVLGTRETLMPGPTLEALLREQRITAVTLPPSSLAALQPAPFPELQTLIVAGESCPASLAATWSRNRRMFNAYGPTETAVCATIGLCDASGEAPHIGRPLANVRVHLLDADLQPVPKGAAGEICVAGWGVAGGYLGRDELTRDRFVGNPHAGISYPASGYERLYRTGDLGRYRDDGTIEFIGRRDGQVKIRGFRIELGEIEAALSAHRGVRQCCVVAREDGGSRHLVAYTVPRDEPPAVDALRSFLQERLPDYMVPTQFVSLPELPVTTNGKIARQLLPAPGTDTLGIDERYVPPRTGTEAALAEIWASVLRLPRVGIHDNFFEIGGDSILAIQIVSRSSQAGVPVTLADLFDHRYQTISALGERVASESAPALASTTEAAPGLFALTPIQRWFFEQPMPARHHYNQTLLFEVPADIDRRALDAALGAVRRHHDALRLRFHDTPDGWRQEYVADSGRAVLDVVTLEAGSTEDRRRAIESEAARQQTLFDLHDGRVFRAVLLTFDDGGTQRLWISAHHLAIDGVSWSILLEDLATAYAAVTSGTPPALPARTTSYRRWAERLADHASSTDVVQELPYWQQVEGRIAALPIDGGDRRQNPSAAAQRFTATIDEGLSNAVLREVPRALHTQINDVLLTAVARAFGQCTNQQQLAIHLEGHGREPIGDVDVTRTVGWFTAMFPVVLDTLPGAGVDAQLLATMATLRRIPAHGIGYGLLRYLPGGTGLGTSMSPEVSFNYLGQAGQLEAPAPWLKMASETVRDDFSAEGDRPHLIDVNAIFLNGKLQFDWIYNPDLHHETTIRRLAGLVNEALAAIVDHARSAGEQMPVTSMQEQILLHADAVPDSDAYRVALACDIVGDLDQDRFRASWQRAIDRHPALRAEFRRLVDGSFRQQFTPARSLSWDAAEGPVFGGPLVSATLKPIAEGRHRFTLHHHHLLLDGWSVSKVVGEVLADYQGRDLSPTRGASVEPYLRWLAQRDADAGLAFWTSELAGLPAPPAPIVTGPPATETVSLGAAISNELRAFAAANRLTLNTVLFGAWAITLASLRNTTDLAIGTVFSGRNAPVDGVDDMVGMLINTLPLRVTVTDSETLIEWLTGLQRRMALAMEHSATSLAAIANATGIAGGGFTSTFRFQNYPIDPAMTEGALGLQIENVTIKDVWHHPLNLSVIPGQDIQVIADYFPSAHGADAIALTLAVFSGVAEQLASGSAPTAAALLDSQFGGVLD